MGRQVAVLGGGAMVSSWSRVTSWLLVCVRWACIAKASFDRLGELHRRRVELWLRSTARASGPVGQTGGHGMGMVSDRGKVRGGGTRQRGSERIPQGSTRHRMPSGGVPDGPFGQRRQRERP